jgi:hypothetical protein
MRTDDGSVSTLPPPPAPRAPARVRITGAPGLKVLILACLKVDEERPGLASGPLLQLLESVQLREADTLYVGRPFIRQRR